MCPEWMEPAETGQRGGKRTWPGFHHASVMSHDRVLRAQQECSWLCLLLPNYLLNYRCYAHIRSDSCHSVFSSPNLIRSRLEHRACVHLRHRGIITHDTWYVLHIRITRRPSGCFRPGAPTLDNARRWPYRSKSLVRLCASRSLCCCRIVLVSTCNLDDGHGPTTPRLPEAESEVFPILTREI